MMDIQKLKYRLEQLAKYEKDSMPDELKFDLEVYQAALRCHEAEEAAEEYAALAGKNASCAQKAEAQLAELAKQPPVSMRYRWCPPHLKEADGSAWIGEWKYCDLGMANPRKDYERQELFTRAALPVPVKLPAEKFCPAEYEGSLLYSEVEQWNKAIAACAEALRAQGVEVADE